MASLAGRNALVTGGGRGIGRAIAAALTAAGASVTVLGRGEDALREAVAAGDANAYAAADVTDAAALKAAIGQAGSFDIMVANAGAAQSAPFAKTSDDQFRAMFELNVMGVVHSTRAVLDDMIARKFGRIVVVASAAGLKGYGYVSAYVAAKHAVVGLVRSLAIETAKTGVTVNAVCPGYTDTPMIRDSLREIAAKTGRSEDEALKSMLGGNPLARLITPQEVAAAVVYLSGADAAAVTGATLAIAGGDI